MLKMIGNENDRGWPDWRKAPRAGFPGIRVMKDGDLTPRLFAATREGLQAAIDYISAGIDTDPEPVAEADAAEKFAQACERQKREREGK